MKKDWCTGFFERWPQWTSYFTWRLVPIGRLICKPHDKRCSSTGIYRRMFEYRIVGGFILGTIASIGCWAKYPKRMVKRLFGIKTEDFKDVD